MTQEFGLSRPEMHDGPGHLNVLWRGFATKSHCEFRPRDDRPWNKAHELKSGKAFFIQGPNGLKQAGPTCAKRLGKQKRHEIPDLTSYAEDLGGDEGEIKSSAGIDRPLHWNEATLEAAERKHDIEYLLLRWHVLPEIAKAEIRKNFPKRHVEDTRPPQMVAMIRDYMKDPSSIDTRDIRSIRARAEHDDLANSLERLGICYVSHVGVDRCLLSRSRTADEHDFLRETKKNLLVHQGLGHDDAARLRALTHKLAPGTPAVGEEALALIPLDQAVMFGDLRRDYTKNELLKALTPPKGRGRLASAQSFELGFDW